jgi:hypothetical protein
MHPVGSRPLVNEGYDTGSVVLILVSSDRALARRSELLIEIHNGLRPLRICEL